MISLSNFGGELPRITERDLPDNAATYANNCDFKNGELRSLKGVAPLQNLSNVAKAIYTPDGINFLSWPVLAHAVKSPVISDSFDRIHFTTPSGHFVTTRLTATPSGGEPASKWKTGAVRPPSAPVVNVTARNALPEGTTLEWEFFYEANGLKYQVTQINPSPTSAEKIGRQYQFTPPPLRVKVPATAATGGTTVPPATPAKPAEIINITSEILEATPADAVPCVGIIGRDTNGGELFHVYSSNSSFAADNNAEKFNGLTITISVDSSGNVIVNFEYGKDFQQTRAFVYTSVNLFKEESAPSDPTTATYDVMQLPSITLPAVPAVEYLPIIAFRVYGTLTSGSGQTDYQLVGEVASNGTTTTFNADKKVSEWGRLIDTINLLPPPSGVINLIAAGNGIEACYKGNEIWFSEPYKPWAYNPENVITLPYGIKGMVRSGSSIVVTTTAFPYIINGTLPANMTERRIELAQAGVSQTSIVDCGDLGVFYLSNDGICNVLGGQGTISMGQRFFTREDWRNRYLPFLDQMILAYYDGALISFSPSVGGSFIIRFDEGAGSYTQHLSLSAQAGFILPQTDSLYLAIGGTIHQYGEGNTLRKQWTSKKFMLPTPQNPGAMQVICEGDLTITVLTDRLTASGAIISNEIVSIVNVTGVGGKYRLPAGYMASAIKVDVSGTGILKRLYIMPTMQALARV